MRERTREEERDREGERAGKGKLRAIVTIGGCMLIYIEERFILTGQQRTGIYSKIFYTLQVLACSSDVKHPLNFSPAFFY